MSTPRQTGKRVPWQTFYQRISHIFQKCTYKLFGERSFRKKPSNFSGKSTTRFWISSIFTNVVFQAYQVTNTFFIKHVRQYLHNLTLWKRYKWSTIWSKKLFSKKMHHPNLSLATVFWMYETFTTFGPTDYPKTLQNLVNMEISYHIETFHSNLQSGNFLRRSTK